MYKSIFIWLFIIAIVFLNCKTFIIATDVVFNVFSMHFTFRYSRVELKKVTEIFTRMFHDPHSKVSKKNYHIFLKESSVCLRLQFNPRNYVSVQNHLKFKTTKYFEQIFDPVYSS